MVSEKTIKLFESKWRKLCAGQQAIDWKRVLWARDLRGVCPDGDLGDAEFVMLCEQRFGMERGQPMTLLAYARAGSVFESARELEAAAGRSVQSAMERLAYRPKSEQIEICEVAKKNNLTIGTIISKRDSVTRTTPRMSPAGDARDLAAYVLSLGKRVPPRIRQIAARYVEQTRQLEA